MEELFLGKSLLPLCIDEVGLQQFEIKIQNAAQIFSFFILIYFKV